MKIEESSSTQMVNRAKWGTAILMGLAMLINTNCTSYHNDVTITYSQDSAKVTIANNDSIKVKVNGAQVELRSKYKSHELNVLVSGDCKNGRLVLTSKGKATVHLNNLSLTSQEGAALWLKNKKTVEIDAMRGTRNNLTVTACVDTASKAAVIWAKGDVRFAGKGELNVLAKGDGCKGINAKNDIEIETLTLNVITEGNNLGVDENAAFGGPMPDFNFDELPDSVKAEIEKMRKMFEENGPGAMQFPPMGGPMPMGGAGAPQMDGAGFPPMQPGEMGGESGDPDETQKSVFKQRYLSPTKAIKAKGAITINSGTVFCKTASAGAEGIEGKKGIVVNGGEVTVDAIDDAINANAPVVINGGKIIAESHCNDAIDVNMDSGMPMPFMTQNTDTEQKPAITINGGEVYAWSHVGAPEEGMDCDFAPLEISGGVAFSIGAGMGEMPSVPTQQTAKQPTLLFTYLNLTKDEPFEILEGNNVVFSINTPFTFLNSSSIVTCPKLQKGKTYTLKTKDTERTFTIEENFTVVGKQ